MTGEGGGEMQDPEEERIPRPTNGWPGALLKFEFAPHVTPEEAARQLCGVSRGFKTGVIGRLIGVAMVAYPHETARVVYDKWMDLRMRDLQQTSELPKGPVARWTPARKLAVLVALGAGTITPDDAHETWGIDATELREWGLRYELHGLKGLAQHNAQDLRAGPGAPSQASEG
jgi:hypothetical protein